MESSAASSRGSGRTADRRGPESLPEAKSLNYTAVIPADVSFAGRRRNDVDAHIDALRSEFGPFEVRERTFEVTRELLADTISIAEQQALGGARALVEHDDSALLVKNDSDTPWDAPGGDRDPGEAYASTARHAVYDIAGVECEITDVHFVLRYEFTLVEGTDGATGLWVLFGAETADTTLAVSEGVADVDWFQTPPEDIAGDIRDCFEPGVRHSY